MNGNVSFAAITNGDAILQGGHDSVRHPTTPLRVRQAGVLWDGYPKHRLRLARFPHLRCSVTLSFRDHREVSLREWFVDPNREREAIYAISIRALFVLPSFFDGRVDAADAVRSPVSTRGGLSQQGQLEVGAACLNKGRRARRRPSRLLQPAEAALVRCERDCGRWRPTGERCRPRPVQPPQAVRAQGARHPPPQPLLDPACRRRSGCRGDQRLGPRLHRVQRQRPRPVRDTGGSTRSDGGCERVVFSQGK